MRTLVPERATLQSLAVDTAEGFDEGHQGAENSKTAGEIEEIHQEAATIGM